MKNELKTLYKKDPVLAQKAAKVLGYKIVAKSYDADYLAQYPGEFPKLMQAVLKAMAKTKLPKSEITRKFENALRNMRKVGEDFLKTVK